VLASYPSVWLNEAQPDNRNGAADNFGEREPWVELHNSGPVPLSLAGYYLADNFTNLSQWAFPATAVIQPGEYLLVWADGEPSETSGTNYHASFRLGVPSGSVVFSRSLGATPQVLDYLNYGNIGADHSFGAYPPGQASFRQEFYFPTPRGTNDPSGPQVALFINEWMAANTTFLRDPADQDFDDWFEIYNPNDERIDLTGYWLTDSLTNPNKFIIPTNITIASRGFLLVWADEESSQTQTNGDLHVNFRLSQGGEVIALHSPQGRLIDHVTFGSQTNNISQGRYPDGGDGPFLFMTSPTPRVSNVIAPAEIRFTGVTVANNILTLRWSAEPGRTYRVQYKNSLGDGNWNDLAGDVMASGAQATRTEPISSGQRFYRILLVQ
jgi:hypothetical protein